MANLNKLLLNASASLDKSEPKINEAVRVLAGKERVRDLLQMLQRRNGFYVFEGALHVFPAESNQQELGLDEWNEKNLWRDMYKGLADDCLFFAEDVFGGQFCIKGEKIYVFDPETGALDYLAGDIEEWAKTILDDYEVLTGYPLAHQWQDRYGRIPKNKRLIPKVPFVAGGSFTLDNLYLADSVEGMKSRANVAVQIRNLPDGSKIKFKIVD